MKTMKAITLSGTAILAAGLISFGCGGSSGGKETATGLKCPVSGKDASSGAACPVPGQGKGAPAGAMCPVQEKGKGGDAGVGQGMVEGTVLQALSAGRYVYVELDTKSGPVWVAAVAQPVAKGDKISCQQGTKMEKFNSPILKRTFDQVYFVNSMNKQMSVPDIALTNRAEIIAAHAKASEGSSIASADDVKVVPAEGGVTIAGLVKDHGTLKGTDVIVRGKVTKYNAAIMGSNWLHLMDGSVKRDLVVTSQGEAKVGDTVLIKGKLECDIDLGYGYSYDIIIRNATITVEK